MKSVQFFSTWKKTMTQLCFVFTFISYTILPDCYSAIFCNKTKMDYWWGGTVITDIPKPPPSPPPPVCDIMSKHNKVRNIIWLLYFLHESSTVFICAIIYVVICKKDFYFLNHLQVWFHGWQNKEKERKSVIKSYLEQQKNGNYYTLP